jgi:hypothetical protein
MTNNTFTWWLVNFGISIIWMAGSIASHNWFLAIGGLVYIGIMMLIELPETSSEEGSADHSSLVFPPDSATQGPLHSEAELGGQAQGAWRGAGPPPR